MLTVDSKTVTEIRKESRHFSARLVFGTKNYDEIDSFTYTSHYSPQKFTVGCVPSASVQCDIRGLTASLPSKLKGQVFRLEISVGEKTENYTPEWISLGEFKITEASVKDGVFSLTAYDKINFIKGDYKSNLTGTQTIADIFNDVCGKIQESSQGFTATNADGKGYVKDTVSSSYTLDVESLKGYPLKDVLSYIAAIFARNLTVNRQGLFELKAYKKPGYDLLNDDRIETPELNESDSTFGYLSAAVDSDTILTSGKTDGSGLLFSCPVMTQKRLDYLQGLLADETHAVHSFRPGKVVQLLGDPRIEVGDVLPLNPVYDGNGKLVSADCYIPVMSLVMKYDGGLMNEITAYDFEEDTSLSAAQRIIFAEQSAKRVTKYATAAAEFSGIIAGGLGLYRTEITDESGAVKTYLHDRPTLEESTYIITFNSQGFASASNDDRTPCWNNGNPTWTDGVSRDGNAVMRTIYANKITADMINVTDLSALKATIGGWNIGKGSLCYPNDHAIYKATGADENGIQYEVGIKSAMGSVNYNNFYVGQYDSTSKSKEIVFAINNSGRLYATKGSISGWTIDRAPLLNANAIYSTAGNYEVGMQGSDAEGRVAFYVKHKTQGDIFYVKNNGTLFASSADITGKITATSGSFIGSIYASDGTIGGWHIDSGRIYSNESSYEVALCNFSNNNTESRVLYCRVGTDGDYTFKLLRNGSLYANNVELTGKITATSGMIGGWNLGTTDFYPNDKVLYTQSSTYEVGLKGSSGLNDAAFYVKKRADGEVVFAVQNNGTLTANNAVIYGDVYASGGKIAGWNIGESSLFGINAIYSIAGNYEIGIQGSNSDSNVAFYVKHKTQGDKFYVKNNGTLFASSADITGKITATSGSFKGSIYASGGTIGGFNIKSYYIVTSSTTWGTDGSLLICPAGSSTGDPKIIGGSDKRSGWVITAGSKFGVDKDGYMFCSGAQMNEAAFIGSTTFAGDTTFAGTYIYSSYDTVFAFTSTAGEKIWSSVGTINKAYALYLGVSDWTMRLNGKSVQLKDGTAVTSDARLKTEIQPFSEAYEKFFMMLSAKTYKYIEGTSDRTHFGFIAQELESAIIESGLTTQDVAAYVSTESNRDGFEGYELSIRYSEIVALNTYMIQKCLNKIKALEDEISILKGVTT